MKRMVKVLSLIFALALMLTIGCLAVSAADPATITVAAGATETINGETFTNTFGKDVTFTYNTDAGRYVIGAVTIETTDAETNYNGKPQSAVTLYNAGQYDATTFTVTSHDINLADYGLSVKVNLEDGTGAGLYKDAGDYPNVLTVAFNELGDTVTDYSEWFHVNYAYGLLTIKPLPVTVTTDSASKTYDGTPLTAPSFTVDGMVIAGDEVITGVTYAELQYIYGKDSPKANRVDNPDGTWYGTIKNTITATENPNYAISYVWGDLKLNPITGLTFEMVGDSASKPYDQKPLKYLGSVKVPGTTHAALVAGDAFVTPSVDEYEADWPVNVTPAPIKVADLSLKMLFRNAAGENIECYAYTLTGTPTLEITPAKVTVTVDDQNLTYGDAPITNFTSAISGALASGESIDLVYACSYKLYGDAGEYVIVATAIEKDATNGLNSNYEITYVQGKLTVAKKAITVKPAEGYTVQYGDAPIADTAFKYHADTLAAIVADDKLPIHFECNYKQFDPVGSSYVIKTVKDAEHKNYIITVENGTLTVTKRNLYITIDDQTLVYRDEALSDYLFWTYDNYLDVDVKVDPTLKDLVISAVCAYTKGDNAGEYVIDGELVSGADKYPNYNIIVVDGTLTVRGYMLENVVWEKTPSFPYDGLYHAPVAKALDPVTGIWVTLTTTEETFVGEYAAYVTGIKDSATGEYIATNYRVNQLTSGVGYYKITEVAPVVFQAANVVIGGNYTVNFKIAVTAINQYGFNFEVVLKRAGFADVKFTDLNGVKIENGYYVFSYTNIAPNSMGAPIVASFTTGGQNDTITYSVEEYCYNLLKAPYNAGDEYLRNVLVAMLRYGAATQLYVDPLTDAADLVTAGLAELGIDDSFVTARGEYIKADDSADKIPYGWKFGYSVVTDNGVYLAVNVSVPTSAMANIHKLSLRVVDANGTVLGIVPMEEVVATDDPQRFAVDFVDCTTEYQVEVFVTAVPTGAPVANRVVGVEDYAARTGVDSLEALIDFSYALQEYTRNS